MYITFYKHYVGMIEFFFQIKSGNSNFNQVHVLFFNTVIFLLMFQSTFSDDQVW